MQYFATAKDMETLDTIATEHGLEIQQMMELAGWHILRLFSLLSIGKEKQICIVVGKGNNGGNGLSAARHLLNHGWKHVTIILAEKELKPDPAHHLELLKQKDISIISAQDEKDAAVQVIEQANVCIDALLGYNIDGAPRDEYALLIEAIEAQELVVISYDIPSGAHPTTGECFTPHITADVTLTLALPKALLQTASGLQASGAVYVGDLGIPSFLYNQIAQASRPEFGEDGLLFLG